LHKQLDEYNKALQYFEKTLKIKRTYFSEDNIEISSIYNDIGKVYLQFDRYNEALQYFIKDVDILKKNYDDNAENKKYEKKYLKSNKYSSLVMYYASKGSWLFSLVMSIRIIIKNIHNIIKFIRMFKNIIKNAKEKPKDSGGFGASIYSMFNYSDKQSIVNNILNNIIDKYIFIADLYYKYNDYNNSLKYYKLAMEMKRRIGMDNDYTDENASLLLNIKISKLYMLLNDTNGAFEYCSKALKLYEFKVKSKRLIEKKKRKYSEEQEDKNNIDNDIYSPNYAELFNILGQIYFIQRKYLKSNEYYDKALLSYNNIIKNIPENDFNEKLKILKEKLVVEIKRYGNDNIDVAKTYYSIGFVYKSLNNHEKRLEFYKKGLEIRIKVQGEEHADTATQYNNVAVAFNSVGDYEKAIEYHNKAILIRAKILGEDHIDMGTSYANIAFVYREIDKHQEALEYFEKALKIYKNSSPRHYKRELEFYNEIILLQNKIFGEENEKTALSLNEIGGVYLKLKEYNRALENAKKALEIRKNIYGDKNVDTATSYFNVGIVYYKLKNNDKALEYYKRALEINKELFSEDDKRVKEVMKCIEDLENNKNDSN
jgi:tetratricopeptide (TPR) repeat protein